MVICPACGATSSDARFCPACGAQLTEAAPERRERRVVTSLFCDLVGFTALSEAADPEDLDRMLQAYFRLAQSSIERHGGVVEKFVGDAVVGVFGVPVAHEDDPARAVRAGLEICRGATALTTATGEPLRLRVGVNTGEALVHLDARPAAGEHLFVGDSVNTSARIQAAAPELGVAVGVRTWEATRLGFDYTELEPTALKGKAERVRLFQVLGERHVPGLDAARSHAGAYVGRERELAQLRAAFADVRATGRTRLAVITGEPGIGKSRLMAELAGIVRTVDPAVPWRQGRCLPYGDGTGFWALGELVKAHAGILEGDDAATARDRLAATLEGSPDAPWLLERLLPLLGLGSGDAVTREEQFGAWARYLRGMARTVPAVIALEDVHWADPALFAFIDMLAEPTDAAILVVLTTRPSISDVAPDLGSRAESPVRLDLQPLTDGETEALIVGLLGSVVPRELHAPILERSRGNPLYAEELVRLLGDRDLLEQRDGVYHLRSGATIPLPDSVHALLAARLDGLPDDERAVIARASVVGEVFWPGAIEALDTRGRRPVRPSLRALEARQLVRRHAASSLAGQDQYAFWHVLLRDVAYAAQPRPERLEGHLAAAAWIERTASRLADVAGVIAHHLVSAYDLSRAVRDDDAAQAIRPRARAALAMAAEASAAIDADAAVALYGQALDLTPADDPERATLLLAYGRVAERSGRNVEAMEALDEALRLHEAEGRGATASAAAVLLAMRQPLMATLDTRWQANALRALDILEPLGPSPLLVEALVGRAFLGLWGDPPVEAREYADRAVDLAERLGLPTPVEALAVRATAQMVLDGPEAGFADFERGFEVALDRGAWTEAGIVAQNYSAYLAFHNGIAPADALNRRAAAICDAHGLRSIGQFHRIAHAGNLVEMGRLADAEAALAALHDEVRASGSRLYANWLVEQRAAIALTRGDVETLRALVAALDAAADGDNADGNITDVQIHAARVHAMLGEPAEAERRLRLAMASDRAVDRYWFYLAPMTRLALSLGDIDGAAEITAGVRSASRVQRLGHRTSAALVAEARGELEAAAVAFGEAAIGWTELGIPIEAAAANLGVARCLAALGSLEDARASLEAARETFTWLGARPWLDAVNEVERVLVPRA